MLSCAYSSVQQTEFAAAHIMLCFVLNLCRSMLAERNSLRMCRGTWYYSKRTSLRTRKQHGPTCLAFSFGLVDLDSEIVKKLTCILPRSWCTEPESNLDNLAGIRTQFGPIHEYGIESTEFDLDMQWSAKSPIGCRSNHVDK
jgi:hypothetical protein